MVTQRTGATAQGKSGQYPLSASLELFCMFDKGENEGAFGPRHLVIIGWRVTGRVDTSTLQATLEDLVVRHEILRTSVIREASGQQHQRIQPPSSPQLLVRELRRDDPRPLDLRVDEFINEVENSTLSVAELPHLRAVLGRISETDSVLVLITHHTAGDGWSMQVLIRELAELYATRAGFDRPALPPAPQYREYAAWQQEFLSSDLADQHRNYWRDTLHGAELLASRMDRRPATVSTGTYAIHRFLLPADLANSVLQMGRALHASPFMVLLAAFKLQQSTMSGTRDVTTATITSGRNEFRFHNTVGPFFNLVPLRTFLDRDQTFGELVTATRKACLDAYAHELPWTHIAAAAPEVTRPYSAGDLAVWAFQLFQFPTSLDGQLIGDMKLAEVRRRLQSYPTTSDIPNGVLWALDLLPTGEIAGHVRYNTLEFYDDTIAEAVRGFRRALETAIASPEAPVSYLADKLGNHREV